MTCRLYLPQPLQTGHPVTLPTEQAHYLRQVMRLHPGDPIILFNGEGGEYAARIEHLARDHSQCHIEEHIEVERELDCRIHVVQAACRSEKIETVLQKCTELGAASFQIVRSERSDLKLDDNKRASRLERWQKIIVEAAEQSGRTRVPEVNWRESLSAIEPAGLLFTLHPEAASDWFSSRDILATAGDITLAIGPEGGWSPADLQRLQTLKFQPLLFGSRIMRTETAAPALVAAIAAVRQA
ncbi:MAG TPA: 16S rRNA (uracil(1498)-N(3))-methyltransferase [Mariprofundaceae bacterium]|nr:16S rRNA (uracil(1498)-N(3))-methyltransferase [Mariprofundaceae bacterium]